MSKRYRHIKQNKLNRNTQQAKIPRVRRLDTRLLQFYERFYSFPNKRTSGVRAGPSGGAASTEPSAGGGAASAGHAQVHRRETGPRGRQILSRWSPLSRFGGARHTHRAGWRSLACYAAMSPHLLDRPSAGGTRTIWTGAQIASCKAFSREFSSLARPPCRRPIRACV